MSATIGPGSAFAGYQVDELIGRGGMGVVYRATDPRLDRPVALKLIAPELAQDERFRSRFLNEPRLAAALDHPNVLPIYDAGESDGQLYLAMRYVDGADLKSLLERDGSLTPDRTVAILAQVADALDAAHRRGLVHRDVKPANILVDADEHAYLTDFGITKQAGAASTRRARWSGRSTTSRPSRSAASRSTGAPTPMLWAACSTSARPASRRSIARRRPRRCGRTCRRSRHRFAATPRSIPFWAGRWQRSATSASPAAASSSTRPARHSGSQRRRPGRDGPGPHWCAAAG